MYCTMLTRDLNSIFAISKVFNYHDELSTLKFMQFSLLFHQNTCITYQGLIAFKGTFAVYVNLYPSFLDMYFPLIPHKLSSS